MDFITYKKRPVVRKDNTIYYGSMADSHIAMLQILSTTESFGEKVPEKISIQLLLTDENVKPVERIAKTSEKVGLFEALDIADIWLTRTAK